MHTQRKFAHFHERHSSLAGVSSTTSTVSTPTTSLAPLLDIKIPKSVKALSGMFVVLGMIILGITFWKIRAWRRRRQSVTSSLTSEDKTGFGARDTSADLEAAVGTEKPRSLLLPPIRPPASSGVGWVPQIKSKIAPTNYYGSPPPYAFSRLSERLEFVPQHPGLPPAAAYPR